LGRSAGHSRSPAVRLAAVVALAAIGFPRLARSQEPPARPVGAAALTGTPLSHAPAGEACVASEQCAVRQGYGSVCVEGICKPYVDKWSLLDMIGAANAPNPPPFKLMPAVFPAIGFSPAAGALIGVDGTLGMFLGDPKDTTISNLQGVVLFTSNTQMIVQVSSTVMTAHNDWELQGDWRFLLFNQDTYGLGTGPTPVGSGFTLSGWGTTAAVAGGQPMDFNMIRFNETVYRRAWKELYAGAGARIDRYFAVQDKQLDLAATPPVVTSNYAYSIYNGFDPNQYTTSGVALSALWDSRDSTINPYRGIYGLLDFTAYPTWLGSSRTAAVMQAELRAYVGMDPAIPRNVLAFWAYFRGVTGGVLPYLALPAIGWDSRNRTGRGYIQGRFRGLQEAYAEVEWRFRLTDNGFLGGVLFANGQSFSAQAVNTSGPGWTYTYAGQKLFEYIQPGGGFGLRFMMNAESRTNVTLDFGFGNNYFGVWLNAGEYF
jgi:hypothetical protein